MLLCCGLNSTINATLSGQIVMEGFLNLRIAPRSCGRMAKISVEHDRDRAGGGRDDLGSARKPVGQLLILSQVVLSMQLPFAVVPLVMFTASRARMGPVHRAALADGAGYSDGGCHHRAEYQVGVRLRQCG